MKRTGVASLPLHYGKAPRWLVARMTRMADAIVAIIVEEYGRDEFLRRVSDPHWFQALGCVLGYDWHSSGVTTVLCSVLKNAVKPEQHGLAVCGGKGKVSRQTPSEIGVAGDAFGFSTDRVSRLQYASRMSAKVDNAAVQDGYNLYHHAFFLAEDGEWAVVQQGMSDHDRTARRYHWLSETVKDFVVEPHEAIVGETWRQTVLDMTAGESEQCRNTSVDLAREKPEKTMRLLGSNRPALQKSLQDWIPHASQSGQEKRVAEKLLYMPATINWNVMRLAYEFQPRNYEELLSIRGVGPATVRGLALVAEIIYGNAPSWKDPVKYSFAYGGKDGVPYPVNRKAMDESAQILKHAVENAKIGNREKLESLYRLRKYVAT